MDAPREEDPRAGADEAERALALEEERKGPFRWRCLEVIAMAQSALGNPEAAVATLRRALEALPEGEPDTALNQRLRAYEAALKR